MTTRDQILDAAAEVMQSLGLGRATTREIAQAAGLSEAALYRHFHDKDELFLSVLRERLPEQVAALTDLTQRVGRRTVRANLQEFAAVALAVFDHAVPVLAALFSEPTLLARHCESLRRSGGGPHKGIELVASYLRAEQRGGRVARGVDPTAAAALLLGACLQRALWRRFAGGEFGAEDDEQFVRELSRVLMRGLAPTH